MQLHDISHLRDDVARQGSQRRDRVAEHRSPARPPLLPTDISERKPLSRINAAWATTPHPLGLLATRNCHDGALRCIIAEEPLGWHLSISHVGHNGVIRRYPGWDEIANARDAFLPEDIGFVMHLPPAVEYVALHDTTFHLHEFPERTV